MTLSEIVPCSMKMLGVIISLEIINEQVFETR